VIGPDGVRFELHRTVAGLVREHGDATMLVDMPMGLPHAGEPVRRCDAEARRLLGPRRASVFSPPCREALGERDHAGGNAVNRAVTGRGLSIQAWNIAPRIRELDELLRAEPGAVERLLECHPELCFAALLGAPASHPKKTRPGREQRLKTLLGLCPDAKARIVQGLKNYGRLSAHDDFLDALVLAVSLALADPAASGGPDSGARHGLTALGLDPVSGHTPRDAAGLPMVIHVPPGIGGASQPRDPSSKAGPSGRM
jgi:predicted RNase H-like nuclease